MNTSAIDISNDSQPSLNFYELDLTQDEIIKVTQLATQIGSAFSTMKKAYLTICLNLNRIKDIMKTDASIKSFCQNNFQEMKLSDRSLERYLSVGKRMQDMIDQGIANEDSLTNTSLTVIEFFFAKTDGLSDEDKKDIIQQIDESGRNEQKQVKNLIAEKLTEIEKKHAQELKEKDEALGKQLEIAHRYEEDVEALKKQLKIVNEKKIGVEIVAPNQSIVKELEAKKTSAEKELREVQNQVNQLKSEKQDILKEHDAASQKLMTLQENISGVTSKSLVWELFNKDVNLLLAKYNIDMIAALHYANTERTTITNVITQAVEFFKAIDQRASELKQAKGE
jgi:hypothetical protein